MANLLTLRLCRYDTELDPVGGISPDLDISANNFIEALISIVGGYHTAAQIKSFYAMTAPEQTAFDTLISKINTGADLASKLGRIHRIRSVLTFWEARNSISVAAYATPDEIENRLLEIDTGF